MTDAGIPVVRDLVMNGRDEYRWQRTDWQFWQYTAGVLRCGADDAAPVEPLASLVRFGVAISPPDLRAALGSD